MTWSYSGDPSSSELDLYRFKISDTDPNDPILTNEEINFIIAQETSENARLYKMFSIAADKFAREIKRSLGPQAEDPTSRANYYATKAKEFKSKLYTAGFQTICVTPIFRIGMHDNV